MSRRVTHIGDDFNRGRGQFTLAELERKRRERTNASPLSGARGPIIVAIAAGLLLGLCIAGFQSAPPALRLQAYDVFGIGAPRSCEEARELGIGQQSRGERYYFAHLDTDKDGMSCVFTQNGWR